MEGGIIEFTFYTTMQGIDIRCVVKSLLWISASLRKKSRDELLSCSYFQLQKHEFFLQFFDSIKIIPKKQLFFSYKKNRDIPRAGARATQMKGFI